MALFVFFGIGATMEVQEWHKGFVQSLEEASNMEKQKKAWLDRTDTDFPVPDELACQIFDDSGIDDLLAEGVVFSEATDGILRRLSALASEEHPALLLSSTEWAEFAREAALALAGVKKDLAE